MRPPVILNVFLDLSYTIHRFRQLVDKRGVLWNKGIYALYVILESMIHVLQTVNPTNPF